MPENFDERIEFYNRCGQFCLETLEYLQLLKEKLEEESPWVVGEIESLLKLTSSEARSKLELLSESTSAWDGKDLELSMHLAVHEALSYFRMVDNFHGMRKVEQFMREEQISYNPELEGKMIAGYSFLERDDMEEANNIFDNFSWSNAPFVL